MSPTGVTRSESAIENDPLDKGMIESPPQIDPTSRPLTPLSLFGPILNPTSLTLPCSDNPVPPIITRCTHCWRRDHATESSECEFQRLRAHWMAEKERASNEVSRLESRNVTLAANYAQVRAAQDELIARVQYLEYEVGLLRSANTQLHTNIMQLTSKNPAGSSSHF
ncbi:hypothetical protein N7466_010307 [Penicillium verhagenii]|uniref:uncharacterized protein n=1 Tax=Penicillium verhagenii TaxID=1562060 RepID=UPI0025459948|nr:uncharacterized protein N7466_010307 [Penicillium verhagenii]KAJ5919364.1 hypothetical protein N7466_010307 [Penicillium verhagenii]